MMGPAAKWADEWNTWGGPELAGSNRKRFLSACGKVGTGPATIRTWAQALVFMSDDAAVLATRTANVDPARTVVGNAEQLVERLGRYSDIGFDEFIVWSATMGRSAAERREAIERFAAEVTTRLTHSTLLDANS